MNSSTTHQAEAVSTSDRLDDAITQAQMLCSMEGEQSEICELAKAYAKALRGEANELTEVKPNR